MTEDGSTPVSRRNFMRAAAGGGAAAAATAATSGSAAAQETATPTGDGGDGGGTTTPTGGGNATATGDGGDGGGETVEVAVGPDGDLVFEPGTDSPLRIAPGTTVHWVWESDTHNIVVESQPEDADWQGHEAIENAGFEYEHTFEVLGEYHYYCQPHRASGMVADIVVTEDPSTPTPGAVEPALPDGAKALGVAAAATMASTLALTYLFVKYGGGPPADE